MLSNPKLWNPYSGSHPVMSDRMSLAGSIVEYMGESVDVHINSYRYTLYIHLIRRWVCRYVRGDVDTSSLAGDTAFAYDTSSVNTQEKHDSPRSRNSDISRKVKSTQALEKKHYLHTYNYTSKTLHLMNATQSNVSRNIPRMYHWIEYNMRDHERLPEELWGTRKETSEYVQHFFWKFKTCTVPRTKRRQTPYISNHSLIFRPNEQTL